MYKHVRTFLAYLLMIAIVLTDIPMVANAEDAVETPGTVTEQSGGQNEELDSDLEETVTETEQTETSEEPQVISELTEKRDEVTKYFAMSDGTIKACIYPQNIHYYENGAYEEINNTLEETSENGKNYYKNKKNSFSVKIPDTFAEDYIEFSDENGYVKFKLLGASNKKLEKAKKVKETKKADVTKVKNANDRATFKSVKGNVDITYDVAGNKLKETIVLYKKTKQSFVFDVQTSATSAVVNNDNSISFYDLDGTEIYKIESPYMTDAIGEYSNEVETLLTKSEEGYTLTYAPNYEWLSDKGRVYPVEIDPTLVQAIYKETVTDTYVGTIQTASDNDIRGSWDVLNIGRRTQTSDGSQIVLRGLIRFDIPSEIGINDCIVDAKLDLVHYLGEGESVNGIQIDAHELTSSFSEGGTWWGNQPSYDSIITDYAIVNTDNTFTDTEVSYDSYNLTKLVNKWHNGTSTNHGILLKYHDDTSDVSENKQVFYFAKQSVYYGSISKFVEITYRNTTGLENYWSYTTQDFGQYGTGYVNNYNGNLVYVHDDMTYNSGINGFTLSHIYNTNLTGKGNNYYGSGWRINLVQKIEAVTVTGYSNVKYKYTDGDGTEHYLVETSDGKIVDEDGLGYTYSSIDETTDDGTTPLKHQLKSKDGTILKFDAWNYLRRIIDSNGNTINLNYSQIPGVDNYLTSMSTSSSGMFWLGYDSNYNLTYITDSAGRKTTYSYASGNLTQITYPDGSNLKFEYCTDATGIASSINWLQNIICPDGRKMVYTFYPTNGRVSCAWTEGITGDYSAWDYFYYSQNQTKLVDQYNKSITYQFDTAGRATCVYDDYQNIYSQSYNATTTSGSGIFNNNKLKNSSNGTVYVNNQLANPVFSNDLASWSLHQGNSSTQFSVVSNTGLVSSKSAKIVSTDKTVDAIVQVPVVIPSDTYTYSGYIKTENVASETHGAGLEVVVSGPSGNKFYYSDFLNGTTDAEIDNGFQRVSVSFTLESGEYINRVTAGLYNASGTVYIDSLQLEEGNTANQINLIDNSSFERYSATYTTPHAYASDFGTYGGSGVNTEASMSGTASCKLTGLGTETRCVTQYIYSTGKAGDVYTIGGWAKASAASNHATETDDANFTLYVCAYSTDGTKEWIIIKFNEYVSDWQFASKTFALTKAYTCLQVYCSYDINVNAAYFDNFFLYRDTMQSYTYDSNGNVVATSDYASQNETFQYNGNNNLAKLIAPTGSSYEYLYDSKNNMIAARSGEGLSYDVEYDSQGNAISTSVGSHSYSSSIQDGKTYYIRLKNSGKYLAVEGSGTANNTNVVQESFTGADNQKWTLEQTTDGYYCLHPVYAMGMSLDVTGGAASTDDNIAIYINNWGDAQKYKINPQGDYTYQLETKCNSDKVVTVYSSTTANNVMSHVRVGENHADQEWFFEDVEQPSETVVEDGAVYQFRARHSGRYLYISGGGTTSGTPLVQFDQLYSDSQKFIVQRYGDTAYYTLSPVSVPEMLLEVSTTLGSEGYVYLQLGDHSVSDRKLFKFEYNAGMQGFYIIPKYDETKALDVAHYNVLNNANLIFTNKVADVNRFFIAEKFSNMITSTATYQDNGNYPHTMTDSRGNTTTYTYDTSRGLATAVTDAKNNTTEYTYNNLNDRLESVKTGDSTVSYQYNTVGALKNITSPSGTIYNFSYDLFGRESKISIGSQMLSETIYRDDYLPLVSRFNYGNGAYLTYEYDNQDRLISEGANGSPRRTYVYDKLGNIAQINDLSVNVVTNFQYDLIGRVVGTKSSDGQNTRFVYDKYNRLSLLKWTLGDISHSNGYIYGDESIDGQKTGLIYGVKLNGTQKVGYQYDELSRLQNRTISTDTPFVTEYTYLEGAGYGTTTTLVKTVKNGSDILEYTYDALGNITTVSKNGVVIEQYSYDALNQLVSAVYGGNTYVYTYDNGGNLTEIKKNDEVIKSYSYGNAEWKDQLTSFNGETITYDAIGNPLTYRNGLSFTWQNGRQLATVSQDGTALASYTYNADGLRTSKTVNGVITDYYWSNGNLQGQKTGEEYLLFLYDENDKAYGFIVKNGTSETTYYYEFNVQGDIIGIIDSTGTRVVEYTYGAWGDIVSVTGALANTIGQKNPIRYRGYYYDADTGFYYVASRYYDAEVCRFISADTTDVIDLQSDFYDKNLYAYCDNNPVIRADLGGELWHVAIGAVVGFAAQYTSNVIGKVLEGESLGTALAIKSEEIPSLIGATVSGALASTGISGPALALANATINSLSYMAECSITGTDPNGVELAVSVGANAILDAGGGIKGKKLRETWQTANEKIVKTTSKRKRAMYKAKKVAIKKKVARNVGSTFAWTTVLNNAGKALKKWFK